MRRHLIGVLLAGVAVTAAACSSSGGTGPTQSSSSAAATSDAPSAAVQGVFGQTAYSPTRSGTAVVTVAAPTFSPDGGSSPVDAMCVTFQVSVTNNGTGAMPFPGNFALKSPDGHVFNFAAGCTSDDTTQQLPSMGLQPQATVAGAVMFLQAPQHGTLMYSPPFSTLDTIEWAY